MKKKITIILGIYLFIMFIVYSGVFRNYRNPETVVRYYFECLKNKEGFLTYHITDKSFFDPDQEWLLYKKYNLDELIRVETQFKEKTGQQAIVQVALIYKNGQIKSYVVMLNNSGRNNWLISKITL
jgi:hypothetical protein